jgi:tricorn protease interacting factor F2/3
MEAIHYQLRLEPDLNTFSFKGRVAIQLNASIPSDRIFLNCLELTISSCRLQSGGQWVPCRFQVDSQKERLQITLPEEISGRIDVLIDYSGVINDKMAGFYRSAYTVEGRTRHIAVTQFEESDARRALPCMDHPRSKAVFDIEIIADKNLQVISNEAIAAETDLGNGKKSVRFLQTPRMSTYLLFFGVGEFETLQDTQDQRVIGAALPGRIDQLDFGLAFGRKALQYCESYFDVPYPLSKMHLIAVPDFAFGAMENWGAITFRENLLLFNANVTSRSGAQRICEVVAHEIVHQWFGNLVTPSDWKYLWLNESFATYFGYGIVDHYYPDWGTWDQFLLGQTESAMTRDALQETFPIEIPGGEHVVINAGTAPIIYSKGGSLLRQIQGYIGKERFQKGLQRYLKSHRYDTASSHHLWEAFETVSDRPVSGMVQQWIEQPGFPLVEARRKGNRLTLSQKRFTYLPPAFETVWPIPIVLETYDDNGESRRQVVMLEERAQTFDLAPETTAIKVNAGQTGFYRTCYPETEDLEALGRLVGKKALGPEDRWGLQNDMFALVRAGRIPFNSYLKFLAFYEDEDAFLPLSSIDANLFFAGLVLNETWRSSIAEKARSLAAAALDRIGTLPAPNEPLTISMLREQLLWHMILNGHEPVLSFAAKQFDTLARGGSTHPDITKSILQAGAFLGGKSALDWLCRHLETAGSEHERMNVLTALGCFEETALIKRAAQYTLDRVPDRNKFIPLVSMATNPHALPILWDWYRDHVSELETFHPLLYERVIASMVPIAGMVAPDAVRSFFSNYLQDKPLAADVIRLSLEKLEINLNMRQASKP